MDFLDFDSLVLDSLDLLDFYSLDFDSLDFLDFDSLRESKLFHSVLNLWSRYLETGQQQQQQHVTK